MTRGSWKIRRKAGEIRLNRRPVSAFVLISRREWEAPWPVKMGMSCCGGLAAIVASASGFQCFLFYGEGLFSKLFF